MSSHGWPKRRHMLLLWLLVLGKAIAGGVGSGFFFGTDDTRGRQQTSACRPRGAAQTSLRTTYTLPCKKIRLRDPPTRVSTTRKACDRFPPMSGMEKARVEVVEQQGPVKDAPIASLLSRGPRFIELGAPASPVAPAILIYVRQNIGAVTTCLTKRPRENAARDPPDSFPRSSWFLHAACSPSRDISFFRQGGHRTASVGAAPLSRRSLLHPRGLLLCVREGRRRARALHEEGLRRARKVAKPRHPSACFTTCRSFWSISHKSRFPSCRAPETISAQSHT